MPKNKLKKFLIFILIIILTSIKMVYAPGCTYTINGETSACDYNSDDFYEHAKYDSENIDWDKFDQSKVPPDRIAEIPPEYVDPSKVVDKSKLTKDQLAYQKESSGEPTINEVDDWQDLEQDARDEVLSEAAGQGVETTLLSPTSGEVYTNGFSLDNGESVRVGYEAYTSVSGFEYSDGRSRAKKAETRSTPDSTAINNEDIEAHGTQVSSSETALFSFRGITIRGIEGAIKGATFETAINGVKATLPGNQIVEITDNGGNKLEFESNDGSITISTEEPARYKIQSGILSHQYGSVTEILVANSTGVIEMGVSGFKCMDIYPVGTYWYTSDYKDDFGITVPSYGERYKLCLNKIAGETSPDSDGQIDFPKKAIELKDVVTYLRLPFDSETYSLIAEPIYEGHIESAEAIMALDSDFVYIEEFLVKGNNSDGHLATTRFGYFEYIEANATTFLKYNTEYYPNVIKKYRADFSRGYTLNNPSSKALTSYGSSAAVNVLSPGSDKVSLAFEFMRKSRGNFYNHSLFEYLVVK